VRDDADPRQRERSKRLLEEMWLEVREQLVGMPWMQGLISTLKTMGIERDDASSDGKSAVRKAERDGTARVYRVIGEWARGHGSEAAIVNAFDSNTSFDPFFAAVISTPITVGEGLVSHMDIWRARAAVADEPAMVPARKKSKLPTESISTTRLEDTTTSDPSLPPDLIGNSSRKAAMSRSQLSKNTPKSPAKGTKNSPPTPPFPSPNKPRQRTALTPRDSEHVFISYSHKDKRWLQMLQTALRPYVRQDLLRVWDDTNIRAGSDWKSEIQQALASAKVAVLLVSIDFLASEFIANDELPQLLSAAETEGLRILWVAVTDSAYKRTAFAKYQAANEPERPLNSLNPARRAKVLNSICEKIYVAMTSR
jgi:hypothetical protein